MISQLKILREFLKRIKGEFLDDTEGELFASLYIKTWGVFMIQDRRSMSTFTSPLLDIDNVVIL